MVTCTYYEMLIGMGKIRLYVSIRKQGSRIESVPLKRLVRLSKSREKRWVFKDGWLILEAYGWFLKRFSVFCVFVLSLFFSDYGKVNFTACHSFVLACAPHDFSLAVREKSALWLLLVKADNLWRTCRAADSPYQFSRENWQKCFSIYVVCLGSLLLSYKKVIVIWLPVWYNLWCCSCPLVWTTAKDEERNALSPERSASR